jgi:uncharacterized protein
MRVHLFLAISLLTLTSAPLHAQAQSPALIPAALGQDPRPDRSAPASLATFQLPSHGSLLNALVYVAPGPGPHPVVVLLHGFPGNERNLDLAQSLRRAGYDVLFFDYRGSWGSPGDFSITHSIEDTQAAIAYLRDPANATKLRADPQNLILIGHSMGGFLARYAAAQDPAIRAVALISASPMAVDTVESLKPEQRKFALDPIAAGFASQGMAPLAGVTPQGLAEEVVANADSWNIPSLAPKLATRALLIITSDDGFTPSNNAFVAALPKSSASHLTTLHLSTDHSYSDHRIALQQAILEFLNHLSMK